MKLKPGMTVSAVCINGSIERGTLLEHTAEQMVIRLIDDTISVIQAPERNVLIVRVAPETKESEVEEPGIKLSSTTDDGVYVDVEMKPDRYYRDENLRVQSLAQLRKLQAEEEKKRLREKMSQREIKAQPEEVQFGFPRQIRQDIPQLSKHSKKKA